MSRLILLLSLSLFVSTSLMAAPMSQPTSKSSHFNRWYVDLSLAYSTIAKEKDRVVYPNSGNGDTQSQSNPNTVMPINIGGGMRFLIPHANANTKFFPEYDLAVALNMTPGYTRSGKGNPYGYPQTANGYSYSYKVNSHALWFNGDLVIVQLQKWQPFVEVGIGYGQNKVSHYTESDYVSGFSPEPYQFGNKRSSGFIYAAGLGVNYQVLHNWRVSLAYLYQNLGKVQLGSSPVSGASSKSTSLTAQTVVLQGSYFF